MWKIESSRIDLLHSANSSGCQFSGATNSSNLLLVLLARQCTLHTYVSRLLIPCRPSGTSSRVLRSSSSSNLLQVPRTNPIFSSRSIHATAPTIWNYGLSPFISKCFTYSLTYLLSQKKQALQHHCDHETKPPQVFALKINEQINRIHFKTVTGVTLNLPTM